MATYDDEFALKYFSNEYDPEDIITAIRRITISKTAYPVICGSGLKNRGIQALLDSVIQYLPSPSENQPPKSIKGKTITPDSPKTVAYAYKVLGTTERGSLVYVRVYSGKLKRGMSVYNVNKNTTEKISRVYRVRAGDYVEINENILPGDIVALAGLSKTASGDTLIM